MVLTEVFKTGQSIVYEDETELTALQWGALLVHSYDTIEFSARAAGAEIAYKKRGKNHKVAHIPVSEFPRIIEGLQQYDRSRKGTKSTYNWTRGINSKDNFETISKKGTKLIWEYAKVRSNK